MKIGSVIQVAANYLRDREPEHIAVTCGADGKVQALAWLYATRDTSLYPSAKRRGGAWNREAGGWTFTDATKAQELFASITKKHPDWPVVGDPSKPLMPLTGVDISHVSLGNGLDVCLVPFPLPYFTSLGEMPPRVFVATAVGKKNGEVALLIDSTDEIIAVVESLTRQGATCKDDLARQWSLNIDSKLRVQLSGWAISLECDLSNPRHYHLAPPQKNRWEGRYPNGIAYSTPIPPHISVQTLPAIPAETGHPLHPKPYHAFQSKVGHPFQSKPAVQAG